jgi:protein SCO1/2
MKSRNLLIGVVLGTALAAGVFASFSARRPPPTPLTATVLPAPLELADFDLLDHESRPVDRSAFAGQWDLVFFGFTNCPDICPLTLQILSTAKRQLVENGQQTLPRIVLVSVDPERDTPEKLAQYIAAFGDDNLGITGSVEEIRKLTTPLGIYFQKHDSDTEFYSVDHSAAVLVVDPEARFHALFSAPHVAENFVRDLALMMKP